MQSGMKPSSRHNRRDQDKIDFLKPLRQTSKEKGKINWLDWYEQLKLEDQILIVAALLLMTMAIASAIAKWRDYLYSVS